MRRELPSGKGASLFGRVLPGWMRASWWEGNFPVRREVAGAVGRELSGGKGASRW